MDDEFFHPEVNLDNFVSQLSNCSKLLDEQSWEDFKTLFTNLEAFQKDEIKKAKNANELNDKWADFYQKCLKDMVRVTETATTFEAFVNYLRNLKIVVKDPRTLWKVLHTNINSQLKVTLHESQLIAAEFFTPEQLFEYGFDQFTDSSLCELKNITNEEALIDIFYAMVGFERACNLPKTYVAKIPQYGNFISQILSMFITLPDFDSQRLVWLIEVTREHLHVDPTKLLDICDNTINDFVKNDYEKNSLNKLYKLCVLSTSPFLQTMKQVPETIDKIFQEVLADQRLFLRKYVLCNFISCDWTSHNTATVSDAFKCWKLYLTNISTKLADKPELPNLLLIDIIEESLLMFEGYYGEVQPTMIRATAMRMDIFNIIETLTPYQNDISANGLRRCWYLLYIAAVCGASDFDIANVKPAAKDDNNTIMLGLDRYGSDFLDYRIALEKLSKKFESEFENFQSMAAFIRKNYKQPTQAQVSNAPSTEE
ncbi:hypothetical protein TRFO_25818 [Tritrichomonas foetus]|uniref:Uncharacterized protein n=1 Tax=Tritrichomonas foetus TaxID=1144522 RepID=A0A1J4K490_9EUKA|nr:hypothetical protein TRFO_25818 [Tritrichomonas foetus]|eukprot:OHT06199.1 hypothetical protein TRFO_25818 [Tritrichomonas foetus]